jgi:hypothetical protein
MPTTKQTIMEVLRSKNINLKQKKELHSKWQTLNRRKIKKAVNSLKMSVGKIKI